MELPLIARTRPQSGVRKMMELAWGRADVVHLEVGEPGFDTPDHVVAAADKVARDGKTKYSPTPGLPELREAAAAKIRAVNGIDCQASQVLVTNGGANALFGVFGTVLGTGDSILLPNPGWSNFTMMTKAFGARPLYYDLKDGNDYLPDIDQLDALVDGSTRALLLNSPSNPLGTVMDRKQAEELFAFAEKHDLWIISDECYDQIDFSGRHVSIGSLEPSPERVISVFSFSKVYAMTGWRVGYAALPEQVVNPMLGLLQPSVMCVNTPAQYGALAALEGPQEYLASWREGYRRNRDLVLKRIAGSRYSAMSPDGGFYVWLNVSDFGETSEAFALRLLEQCNVAVTPGTAFGTNGEGYVRLSLATTNEQLELGLERLLQA
ncbi:pyridoxal phosphate-dependent aminotransferase [Pseudaminobacter soli (ex Li et al. 2025)]|uniref:Aminotransferase n=1 Tax=Pseudaminobacter soli (ex Li et al. 2025) TaxID=1295366 RepID=A0A2P7S331_9HYPH|nr:aminotransferase class I/II-fold pyridoxal phosphate-dependent enzyme [Mesorhizobium soli]PSJ56872.1 aspartate aminotransferase [Mesorhizobium soli]